MGDVQAYKVRLNAPFSREICLTFPFIAESHCQQRQSEALDCSTGSFIYSGKDVTDICDGVLRCRRGLLARRVPGGAPTTAPLLMVPASCSAVNSLGPFPAVSLVFGPERRPRTFAARYFREQTRTIKSMRTITETTIGTCGSRLRMMSR